MGGGEGRSQLDITKHHITYHGESPAHSAIDNGRGAENGDVETPGHSDEGELCKMQAQFDVWELVDCELHSWREVGLFTLWLDGEADPNYLRGRMSAYVGKVRKEEKDGSSCF
jgi:hypothetical protein